MMTTNPNNKRAADQLDDSKRRKMIPVPELQASMSSDSSSDESVHFSTPHKPTLQASMSSSSSDDSVVFSTARNVHCVLFKAEPLVSLIPNRLEYSEQEREDMWYGRMEKQAMIQGALKSAYSLNPNDATARGLEPLTFAGSQRRRANRYHTTNAVLNEQARLRRKHGDSVPANSDEMLSLAVAHISRRCQEMANMQGRRDEVEAFPERKLKVPGYSESMDMDCGGKGDMLAGFTETLRGFSFGWLSQ